MAKLKIKKGEIGGEKSTKGDRLIEEVPPKKVSVHRLETSLFFPWPQTPETAQSWSSAPHGALGRAFLLGCEETTPERGCSCRQREGTGIDGDKCPG